MNTERIKEIQSKTAYPDSQSVQQALEQVWNECTQSPEKQLDKISPTEKDIILMKGEWTRDEIQSLGNVANKKGFNSILIVIPDDKSLETMPLEDFCYLIKEIENKRFELK